MSRSSSAMSRNPITTTPCPMSRTLCSRRSQRRSSTTEQYTTKESGMVRVVALSILALVLFALPASAQTMRLDDGTFGYKVVVYDKDGSEGSGVGGGDASEAEQEAQTALLTTIDSSLEIIDNVVFGAGTAAAALRTTLASDDPAVALLTTSDASLTSIVSNTDRTADNLDTLLGSLAEDSVHGNAAVASGPQSLGEAKDIDGGALPNVVTEGQAVRAAFTL